MQPIKKALRNSFILSIILTLCLPLGGVMMGVGFAIGQPAVWGIGIGLLAVGFYGTAIGWALVYAPKKALYRVVSAVMEEHLHTVNEIAVQLSMSEKDVRNRLDICFRKHYLTGYKREGDAIVLNDNRAPAKRSFSAECPYCGAKFAYTADDPRCPYCGSPVQK